MRGARQLTCSFTPGVVELLFCVVLVSSRVLRHLVWSSFSFAWCSSAHASFHTGCGRAFLLRGARQLTRSSTSCVVELIYCVVLVSSRALPHPVWSSFSSAWCLSANARSFTPGVVELIFCVVLVSSRALPHLVWSNFTSA